jgi:hypothetical protein
MFPFKCRLQRLAVSVSQHVVDDGYIGGCFADAIHGAPYCCARQDAFGAGLQQQRRVIHCDHRFVFSDQDAFAGETVPLHGVAFARCQ